LEGDKLDPSIEAIQALLDKAARALVKYGAANNLSGREHRKLEKFIFGLMNQKMTIDARVQKWGSEELEKVLRYIGRASEAMIAVGDQLEKEESEK
jgi:fructose-1,6-bisphosphatase